MFSFQNHYNSEQIEEVVPQFNKAINNNSYPLRQSKVQGIRMNYLPLTVDKQDFEKVKIECGTGGTFGYGIEI